jgi:hypothetical protein
MNEPPPLPQAQAEGVQRPAMTLAARLLNVFATPGEVFSEVKAAPHSVGNWLVPALLFVLVSWIGGWLVFSQPAIKQQITELTDKAIQQQVEKAHLSGERAEQMRKMSEIVFKVQFVLGPFVVVVLTILFWSLFIWVGGKLWKGDFGYMKAVEVIGLATSLMVLDAVIRTLLIVVTGSLFASPSLALLVKDFSPENPQHSLLGLVNVMTLWILTVRSIGLSRLAGISFARAALWVFSVWIAYTSVYWGIGAAMRKAFA